MPDPNTQGSQSADDLRNQYRLLLIALGNVHDKLDEAGEEAWDGPLEDIEELADKNNCVAIELAAGRNAIITAGATLVAGVSAEGNEEDLVREHHGHC